MHGAVAWGAWGRGPGCMGLQRCTRCRSVTASADSKLRARATKPSQRSSTTSHSSHATTLCCARGTIASCSTTLARPASGRLSPTPARPSQMASTACETSWPKSRSPLATPASTQNWPSTCAACTAAGPSALTAALTPAAGAAALRRFLLLEAGHWPLPPPPLPPPPLPPPPLPPPPGAARIPYVALILARSPHLAVSLPVAEGAR